MILAQSVMHDCNMRKAWTPLQQIHLGDMQLGRQKFQWNLNPLSFFIIKAVFFDEINLLTEDTNKEYYTVYLWSVW